MSDHAVNDSINMQDMVKIAQSELYEYYGDMEPPTTVLLWTIVKSLAEHIYELERTILSHPELGPLHVRK